MLGENGFLEVRTMRCSCSRVSTWCAVWSGIVLRGVVCSGDDAKNGAKDQTAPPLHAASAGAGDDAIAIMFWRLMWASLKR